MPLLKLDTPPPSVNAVWRSVGNKVLKSAEYRAWMSSALWQLKPQVGLDGPCYWSCTISIPGDSTGADLDNLPKAILDALHQSGKTPDDRYLVSMSISFGILDHVMITVMREGASHWGSVRGASPALIKKLGG